MNVVKNGGSLWRAVAILALMFFYWCGTASNALRYFDAVARTGDYDAYSVYLYRETILNFPVRACDSLLGCSGHFLPDYGARSQDSLDVIYRLVAEILVVDFVCGSVFWLFVLFVVFFVVWRPNSR